MVVTMKNRSVSQIICDCGGPQAISEASQDKALLRAGGKTISAKGVHKWKRIGIPDWHWPLVVKLCDASIEELYRANARLAAQERQRAA